MDVKTLCLSILSHGEASGYEIKKQLEEGPYAYLYRASFGSIYPALAKLAEAGLVSVEEREQDKRPDKKVYRMTPEGRRELVEQLQGPLDPDYIRSDFFIVLFHADLLPTERLRMVIDARIAWLRALLEHLEQCSEAPKDDGCHGRGPEFVLDYGLAVRRAELAYLETNRHRLLGPSVPPTSERMLEKS